MKPFFSSLQIRPCSVYKDEYKDCKSWRGRFNQYFIYGETLSCDQWQEDNNNCFKWSWMKDKEAAIRLIESELKRKANRIKMRLENDIWTKRDSPPADWIKPLPDFMIERNKNSYLELKCKELEDQEEKDRQDLLNAAKSSADTKMYENKNSFCTFM